MEDSPSTSQWKNRTGLWLQQLEVPKNLEDLSDLKEILRFHEKAYYVRNIPLISDAEYDLLFNLLKKAEQENPEWVTPDSPTQRVGNSLNEGFVTVSHLVPMLSLENSYDAADLNDWDRKVRELGKTSSVEYCVEPKFDGASISVIYENDRLVRSATRGDGVEGDDITMNSRQIKNLPLYAPFSKWGIQTIEIRGEVLMTKNAFNTFNAHLIEKGLQVLANPRNAAAGTLRMKDPAEVGRRKLEAFLYHVSEVLIFPETTQNSPETLPMPETHFAMLQMLWEAGLRSPVAEAKTFQNIEGVIDWCSQFEAGRDDLPYEIDGMVVKVNPLTLHERLGMTTHHPRWAIAYKFKARQATTRLRLVEFQVGRTGAVTPVAKLDPVSIGGVTVSSISIHNEEYIREKDLMLGDTVTIERAGDVIPQIVRTLPELRDGSQNPIVFPKECPVCESVLFKEEGEAVWRCVNVECKAQVVEKMVHFVSKDALDIKSFGEQQVKKFYDLNLLKDIPGIYQIDYDQLKGLEGFGKKSIDNLQTAIEASKKQPLHRLIYGLGIRHVGETTAKALAQRIEHLLDLKDLTVEQLMEIEDIGPKVATSIAAFFSNEQNLEMLHHLENLGLNLLREKSEKTADGLLTGRTFLFTGTLTEFKRSDAEAMVEKAGGQILGGVSSKLNYLVVGSDAGSKLEKARKIPTIRILTEQEFLNVIAYDQEN